MQRYISYTWGKLGEVNGNWRNYNPNMSDSSLTPGVRDYDSAHEHSGSAPNLWNPSRTVAPVRMFNADGELTETLTAKEFRKRFGPVRKKGHERKTEE